MNGGRQGPRMVAIVIPASVRDVISDLVDNAIENIKTVDREDIRVQTALTTARRAIAATRETAGRG